MTSGFYVPKECILDLGGVYLAVSMKLLEAQYYGLMISFTYMGVLFYAQTITEDLTTVYSHSPREEKGTTQHKLQ